MQKLIAIDLDGTLLNSSGQVSEKNKETLKRAIDEGNEVIIASGRPFSSAITFANDLGADNYVICGNGSLLYDVKNNSILYNKCIEKSKALQLIKICDENSIYYCVYTDTLTIAKSFNYNVAVYNNENQSKPEDKKTKIKIVEDIYKYIEELENPNVLKITICDNDNIIFGSIRRKLSEVKDIDVLEVEHMSRKTIKVGTESFNMEYYYTEITSQNVNKWNAIKILADKLNIDNNDIITIGDNINDKEMIVNAGVGIIMGNSAPYLKEFADVIVSDNNNDGVAEAIEKCVLNK